MAQIESPSVLFLNRHCQPHDQQSFLLNNPICHVTHPSGTHQMHHSKPPPGKAKRTRGGDAIVSVYGCFVTPLHSMFRRKQAHFRFKYPAVPRGSSMNRGFRPKYEDELPRPSRYRHSAGVFVRNFLHRHFFEKSDSKPPGQKKVGQKSV